MTRPLAGLRVLEMGHLVAAPFAGMILSELGADVIKVEPLEGDPAREFGPPFEGSDAVLFLNMNRGKRSIAMDLRHDRGRAILDRCLRRADAFLTNYRAQALDRLGLSTTFVRERFGHLIHVRLSSFGGAAYRDVPAVDINIVGMSGLMMASGWSDSPPIRPAIPIADLTTGLLGVIALLTGLEMRRQGHPGVEIEVPMMDAMAYLCQPLFGFLFGAGRDPDRLGNGSPYGLVECFRTADGYLTVAAPSDRLFRRLCQTLETPHLAAAYPTAAHRNSQREELLGVLATLFLTRPTGQWIERLREADVPCGAVNRPSDAVADPYFRDRHLVVSEPYPSSGSAPHIRFPLELDRKQLGGAGRAPLLGSHSGEILRELGYSDAELAELLTEDIVRSTAVTKSG